MIKIALSLFVLLLTTLSISSAPVEVQNKSKYDIRLTCRTKVGK